MNHPKYIHSLLALSLLLSAGSATSATMTDSRKISMSAYVGQYDSILHFNGDVEGVQLTRKKDINCDIYTEIDCITEQYDVLGDQPVRDNILTQYTGVSGTFVFEDGNKRADVRIARGQFSERSAHQTIFFNNKLMLIGGQNPVGASSLKRTIVSHDHGASWRTDLSNGSYLPGYGLRENHRLVEFKNKIWMIGGGGAQDDGPVTNNDVWSSINGADWVEENPAASFAVRSGFDLVNFNDKLFITGTDYNDGLSKVWSSTDGINWVTETTSPAYGARAYHQSVAFDDRMWIIGGYSLNDVWSSIDGVNWILETADAGFPGRQRHQVEVHNGKMYLVGGTTDTAINYYGLAKDVWSSDDGVIWNKLADIPFGGRTSHQLTSDGQKLVLTGGIHPEWEVFQSTDYVGDTWISEDGTDWELATHAPKFGKRAGYQVVEFQNKLWLFGGRTYDEYKPEIWSSIDGLNWTLEAATLPVVPSPFRSEAFHYGDYVWIITEDEEFDGSGFRYKVYNSPDALIWSETSSDIELPANFDVYILNNKINVRYYENGNAIVRTSTDGVAWVETSAALPSGFSGGAVTAVFNNKLWATGGSHNDASGNPVESNDVWSSVDGLNWTLETNTAWNRGRWYHRTAVSDGKLWVISGGNKDVSVHSETWSSVDGVNWVQQGLGLSFKPEPAFTTATLNDELIVFGGTPTQHYYNDPINSMWVYDTNEWRVGYQHEITLGLTYYDIKTAEIQNGSISPQGQSVLAGDEASFNIIPANGYMIDEVFGCDGELVGSVFSVDPVVTDCTLAATFVPGPVVVTTRVTMGQGTITPEYSEVPEGTILTLTVTADEWYAPYRVKGCNGTWSASTNTYTVGPLMEDCEVTASFRWDWW